MEKITIQLEVYVLEHDPEDGIYLVQLPGGALIEVKKTEEGFVRIMSSEELRRENQTTNFARMYGIMKNPTITIRPDMIDEHTNIDDIDFSALEHRILAQLKERKQARTNVTGRISREGPEYQRIK